MSRFSFVIFSTFIALACWVSPAVSVLSNGVPSATDQQAIVDQHNALRSKVATGNEPRGRGGSQPPAANMRQVKWDASLANAALYKTNLCQATALTSASAGIWGNGYKVNFCSNCIAGNWSTAIQVWYDEVQLFNPLAATNLNLLGSGIKWVNEYATMMISQVYVVGCSYNSACKPGPLYICAYGPLPPPLPTALYQKGTAATACPNGTKPTNNGLCN